MRGNSGQLNLRPRAGPASTPRPRLLVLLCALAPRVHVFDADHAGNACNLIERLERRAHALYVALAGRVRKEDDRAGGAVSVAQLVDGGDGTPAFANAATTGASAPTRSTTERRM